MSSPQLRGSVPVLSAALAVGLAILAWMTEPSQSPGRSALAPIPYTISKETTWITEPLRPDGAVDYVAALNARLSEGVTPENNAAVLLMEVMGSGVIEPEIREEFYRLLGVPLPESTEGALQSYWDFLGDYLEENERSSNKEERQKELNEKSFESYGRTWTREEFPIVAQWLEENEQAINLIVAASQRPRLYVPIVPKYEDYSLIGFFMYEFTTNLRESARILSTRSMFFIGKGEFKRAKQDLMACHQLGSLIASGSSINSFHLGSSFEGVARDGELAIAQSDRLAATDLASLRQELSTLPPFPRMSHIIDLGERYYTLDAARVFAWERTSDDGEAENQAAEIGRMLLDCPQRAVWSRFHKLELDWNVVLTIANVRYSQVVEALKQPTFSLRVAGLQELEDEFMKLREESQNPYHIALLLSKLKSPRETISREFGNEFTRVMIEISGDMAESEVRLALRRQMILVALALAEHKQDQGSYPAKLSELSPKYLRKVPLDGFTERSLKYQREKKGYLLYSVGPNGQDDKGERDYSGSHFGEDDGKYYPDDIAIRIPKESE